ncbi:hypothetical protein SAMN05444396_103409 [Flavobacterium segetis]|uniref:Uncharacterized protein n=1 Tax=Flavobacterium segetis TaxID=271157 RepID=A0A1M5GBW4_9FLAO|nr:hypothetical protein SAMN05444396_103409 [Flavobacterium segetis]
MNLPLNFNRTLILKLLLPAYFKVYTLKPRASGKCALQKI